MVHALLSGAIGVMAIAFLAFCYQGFARTKKKWETSASHVVHPLGQIDFFRKPQTAPLYLLLGGLIATILTTLIYVQSNRQSMRQLEQQIQQLRQQVNELQSQIVTLPNKPGMTGEKNTPPVQMYSHRPLPTHGKWNGSIPTLFPSFAGNCRIQRNGFRRNVDDRHLDRLRFHSIFCSGHRLYARLRAYEVIACISKL